MTTLPASSHLTNFLMRRGKPQAKSLSPAARCLFGKSDASLVEGMFAEVLTSERRKAISEINFDICKERPVEADQQENISDAKKTPEIRRRYQWKTIKSGEAPEYYSRLCPIKRSLEPTEFPDCSSKPGIAVRQPKPVRGNPGVRRSTSESAQHVSHTVSPLRPIPSHFSENAKIETPVLLPKPQAVHATSVNALTVKNLTPSNRAVSNKLFQRSPLTQRNQSGFCRALNFISITTKSPTTSTNIVEDSGSTPSFQTSCAESSLRTPKNTVSANSAMKQLKITDMATIRKPRSSVMKARKRLRLPDDRESSSQPKSHKMANQESV